MLPVTLDISFSCSRFFPTIFFKEIFLFKLMQVWVSFLFSCLLLYWLARWGNKPASVVAINSAQQGYQLYLSNIHRTIREIPRLLKGRFFFRKFDVTQKNMPNHYLTFEFLKSHFVL